MRWPREKWSFAGRGKRGRRCLRKAQPACIRMSLEDPANDLKQGLRSAQLGIEDFSAEYEKNALGISLDDSASGMPKGSPVLDDVAAFIQRFVILNKSELLIITLWIAHTWAVEVSDPSPYLAVTSAEMRSGKTRLLEILELLVRNPWRTGRITPAALYRKIESDAHTLLLDEWDATARGDQEFSETLRGILNAGHRRNGKVSVCAPKSAGYQPTDYSVFCPKVIAGIAKLRRIARQRTQQGLPVCAHALEETYTISGISGTGVEQ